jgi:hypothetical protein
MRVPLDADQEELLTILVEASRAVPRDQRHEFIYVESFGGGASLIHNGVSAIGREQYKPYLGDPGLCTNAASSACGRAGDPITPSK